MKFKEKLVSIILASWSAIGLAGKLKADPISNAIDSNGIYCYIEVNKPSYNLQEPVNITYKVTNNTDTRAIFSFSSSQQYDFLAESSQRELWRWSHDLLFTQAFTWMWLDPGF
jgi:hypothetical protein